MRLRAVSSAGPGCVPGSPGNDVAGGCLPALSRPAPPSAVAGAEARLVPKPVEAETPFVCPSDPDVSCLWIEGRVFTCAPLGHTSLRGNRRAFLSHFCKRRKEKLEGYFYLFF